MVPGVSELHNEADLLHDLAVQAYWRSDVALGIPVAERALMLRTGTLGTAHRDVARDLSVLGALYHLGGRNADADDCYWRALAIAENCYGPDHVEVATTCANLAAVRAGRGDFEVAEALCRRSLRVLQTQLGPENADAGLAMLNLAAAIAGQDRLGEASAFADCARAILSERLSDDHPYVQAARSAVNYYQGQCRCHSQLELAGISS